MPRPNTRPVAHGERGTHVPRMTDASQGHLRARDELTSFSGLWRLRLCYGGPGGVVGAALPGAAAASE